jgi:hypothetical protein
VSKRIQNISLIIPTAENRVFNSALLFLPCAMRYSLWRGIQNMFDVALAEEAEVHPGHWEGTAIGRVIADLQNT